jgi:hypothetical protein
MPLFLLALLLAGAVLTGSLVLVLVRGGSRRDAARLDARLAGYWIDTPPEREARPRC